jgi:hypothetical protein
MNYSTGFFTEDLLLAGDEYESGFMMYGSADALTGRVAVTCMLDCRDSMFCLLAYVSAKVFVMHVIEDHASCDFCNSRGMAVLTRRG